MDHSIHNIPVFKGKLILSRLVHGRINHKCFYFHGLWIITIFAVAGSLMLKFAGDTLADYLCVVRVYLCCELQSL